MSISWVFCAQVAALVPKAELEGDMGETQMALQARLMSKALRRLTHSLNSSQCLLIFINQVQVLYALIPTQVYIQVT